MIKQALTFAEKMEQAKRTRKANIKLNVVATHASKSHARTQKSQYVQQLTATQAKIQVNEERIEEIRDYLYSQYKSEGYTVENLAERNRLDDEKMALLHETHYLRNPQRTPEMDKDSYYEAGGKYQNLSRKVSTDHSTNTFGEFDAEWF